VRGKREIQKGAKAKKQRFLESSRRVDAPGNRWDQAKARLFAILSGGEGCGKFVSAGEEANPAKNREREALYPLASSL
jgi:hypothetical protein